MRRSNELLRNSKLGIDEISTNLLKEINKNKRLESVIE
jgi:hypothetical protein